MQQVNVFIETSSRFRGNVETNLRHYEQISPCASGR